MWYVIKSDSEEKQFVNSKLITTEKPIDQKQSGGSGNSSTTKPSGGNSSQQSGGNSSSNSEEEKKWAEEHGFDYSPDIPMSDCISF